MILGVGVKWKPDPAVRVAEQQMIGSDKEFFRCSGE